MRKKYFIWGFIFVLLAVGLTIPFIIQDKVKLSKQTASDLKMYTRNFFDNPVERLAAMNYQITEQRSDGYVLVGRTIFGIPILKGFVKPYNGNIFDGSVSRL